MAGGVAGVSAILADLIVEAIILLEEDVSVDMGSPVAGVILNLRHGAIDEIEKAAPALDPIVANHGSCGAILKGVAAAFAGKRAEAVELKGDAQRFGVGIMLMDPSGQAVAVEVASLDD